MIKKLLFTLLIVLIHTVGFGATKTYSGSGNWNVAANWSGGTMPTGSDDVIISSGQTVIVTMNDALNAFVNNLSVLGTGILTINDGKTLTIYGNVIIDSGAKFNAGTGNSDSAIIKVYGDFVNQGTANFWKSTVVIGGNLITASTILQNNGNIIVGGNVSGVIGGSGTGTVYPVNPNATVTVTGSAVEQPAGTVPSDATLVSLMNAIIYGNDCPFTITGTTNTSDCIGGTAIFTASTDGSSPSYQWEINMGSGWSDLLNNTVYSGVNTATLTVSNTTGEMNNYKFRARITVAGCTEKGNYGFLMVSPSPTITTQPIDQLDCEGHNVNFSVIATGIGLTYSWKYKKPADISFTNITSATSNVENLTTSKITIINAGSAQFPNGTLFQVIVSNGTCNISSSIVTLSLNEITDITSGTSVNMCYGSNHFYTVTTSYPSNVVSYQWKKSIVSGTWTDVEDGVHYSGAASSTLNIINGTPNESAKYRVYITFHSSGADCNTSSDSRTRSLIFLPLLLTPETVITQPTCSTPTGVLNVTVQSATDTYSFDNGSNYQVSNVKSGLVAGTYKVIIKNIKGCISSVTNCVITGPVVSTWNGSAWSPSAPTSIDKIIFNGNYLSSGDLSGCSCQVNSGTVVVKSGHTLSLADELTVSGGSLTFENNSSLIQTNTGTTINTGNITYERLTSTPINNFDYTYWSSPVSPQKLIDVSPNTSLDKFYSFNLTVNDWQQEDPSTNMTSGVGYIIRGPQTYVAPAPPNFYQAAFKGVPNNGVVTVVIPTTIVESEASALLGNPYPSALDADSFLIANMPTALEGTLYFWTHNTNIGEGLANLGSGAYAYTSDDYATYNLTGGAATGIGTAAAGINNSIPNGKIASGQAFFAGVKPAGGTVTFNNSMRLSSTGTILDNSQFFKLNNTKSKATNSIEKDRVWLNLFNSQGAFKQTLVGYITGATNEYDNGYDGETFDGNEFVDFYSVNQDRNLVIQGRALPFDETDEVPMGYKTTIAGDFTIAIAETDGLLATQEIFLEDKITKSIKNLKVGPYTFSSEAGTFNDRFVLRFTNVNKTLGTNNFETLGNTVLVSNKNKQIKINSSVEMIDKVQVYDLLGRSIYQKINVNTTEFLISNLVSNRQALLVKIILQNGQTVTKKIIY